MRTTLFALAALTVCGLFAAAPATAVELGDDGLHKPTWLRETFKDLSEDLDEANAEGKRLLLMFEQRGCIYCTRMQTTVLPEPKIDALIREHYFVVQMNLFGDVEVTDFDGTTLPEKEMALRWGIVFTPTLMFLPEEVPEGKTASQAAVVTMPGAFDAGTTASLFEWVRDKGYEGEEHFQKYLARTLGAGSGD